MSDFIYNDNLNGNGGSKEPINFSFEAEKTKSTGVSSTALIVICVLCITISAIFGILGGIFVTRGISENSGKITINEIARSPYDTLPSNAFGPQYLMMDTTTVMSSVFSTILWLSVNASYYKKRKDMFTE